MARSTLRTASFVFAALLAVSQGLFAFADDSPLIAHGSFDEWKDGLPVGWKISVGAKTGKGEGESRVEKGADGGLALAGDSATGTWRYLSQRLPVASGKVYEVTFEGRAQGLRREGDQRDNDYVGLTLYDGGGRRLARTVQSVDASDWKEGKVVALAPAGAAEAEVGIFLSKTGRLEVRNVRARERRVEETFAESFEMLVADMERHYSYFEIHGRRWDELAARSRPKAEKATDLSAFVSVLTEMLGGLEDPHVWIVPPDGKLVPTFSPEVERNYDYEFVAKERLKSPRQIGRIGLTGRTSEGYAYVAVGSLQGDDAAFAALDRAIEELLDAPGLLLDLRGNMGGEEIRAQHIASTFADKRRVYAKARFRSGPGRTDFTEPQERFLAPRDGATYTRPIVCLIGRRCLSSGEGFVKMMKALPHVTLVGQPTRGASGNPAPVTLPCGVAVFYSRWIDMLPDGTVLEGRGIAPDVVVEHTGKGDPTFDAAVKELARRIAARREDADHGGD
jgi:hypothetical protein